MPVIEKRKKTYKIVQENPSSVEMRQESGGELPADLNRWNEDRRSLRYVSGTRLAISGRNRREKYHRREKERTEKRLKETYEEYRNLRWKS